MIVGDERYAVPDSARRDPGVIERDGLTHPSSFCANSAIVSGNFVVVGDDDVIAQPHFECSAAFHAPARVLGPEIKLAYRDERDTQGFPGKVGEVGPCQVAILEQLRNDIGIKNEPSCLHQASVPIKPECRIL